ncbi:MAG: HAD family phosphatase [Bacteroidetes bacterium]|nr:HAD family phosphatase [Bacteroidota bacterium]
MKSKYSAIVFDLGNVLLNFDYQKVIRGFENIASGLGNKFADYYRQNYEVHRKFERGDYSGEQFTEIMLRVLENKVSKEEFYRIYSEIFTPNNELVAALPVLRQHYKLVIMSNTNSIHYQYGWKDFDFLKHFDKMILSYEVGSVKPEDKIYKAVESYTGVPPSEHFYTDDVLEYISAARQLGWDAAQFIDNATLFSDFEKRSIVFRNESD